MKDRSQRMLQPSSESDEVGDFLVAPDELLHVGDEAIGLDRVAKARRRLLAPAVEGRRERQAIEARVDLDRVELFRIAFEPALLGKALRIEESTPMLVDPAGAADMHFGNSWWLHRCS